MGIGKRVEEREGIPAGEGARWESRTSDKGSGK
jgi:hypothetical protein